jgi:hypothetical protein
VLEEFKAAQALSRVVVPIGATGGAARQIWQTLASPPGLSRREFERLNEESLSVGRCGETDSEGAKI